MNLMEGLIKYLKPFKEITDMLETSSTPTLYLVTYAHYYLLQHFTDFKTDFEPLKNINESCLKYFNENFKINMFHKIAMFLNPSMKKLKCYNDEEKRIFIRKLEL